MDQIDYVIDPDATDEDARDTEAFFAMMNKQIEEGKIRMEVDESGEPRFYSVDRE